MRYLALRTFVVSGACLLSAWGVVALGSPAQQASQPGASQTQPGAGQAQPPAANQAQGTNQAPATNGQGQPAPAAEATRLSAYPQRPAAPRAVLDRGRAVYGINCAFCHGSDAAGGETGPNLLRSGVVLDDDKGERIAPIVHGGRQDRGMPRIDINDEQIADIAAWLHSLRVASRTGAPPVPINIVTGDAGKGKAAFGSRCASCHTESSEAIQGIGSRFSDARQLQQTWLLPGSISPRGFGGGGEGRVPRVKVPPVTVTVAPAPGSAVTGELVSLSDFYVSLREPDGNFRSFAREGDRPRVEVHDPLKPHRDLLHTYTDTEIHDITAFLVTLK